jgi:hypothetical protein
MHGCKHDNRRYDHLFKWVSKKQWDGLLGWCDKLQLVTKGDWFKIHDFDYGQIFFFDHGIFYYYVKVWTIIMHDHAILKAIQIF